MSSSPSLEKGEFDHIPVIDLAPLRSPLLQERQRLAREIYTACTQVGFFYIKNHGIPEELIATLREAAQRFFSLPEEQKMETSIRKSKKYRGFIPLNCEQPTGTDLEPAPEPDPSTAAFSEAFDIGYELDADPQRSPTDTLPADAYELYGDNQWPRDDLLPGFREVYRRYFAEALTLCRAMIRIFALALDLPEDFFDPMVNYPGATSRMLHYPPQPAADAIRIGLGEHTDYECFTLLLQDQVPALQVRNSRGEWILAPPIPGTLVVNIADCLSIWTNKIFKSTIHRVTNLTGQERYTIPFFFGVDYDTTVSVLPSCISDDRPACKPAFKAGEWVRHQMTRAYPGYEEPARGDS
ncbi:Clavaminate synthase-like protein [Aspergillus heteromorphus CBS 117.55]|uniref:Clavaminate synthase-like protein n=1 Tax=Aspergillus heteromorphus CBS 117.55 TaxID=1448321 RepID=A0A317V111_9EURO|nr:Clavaminate synthase-like protein [Aspergillus heteromorphus CBS 117.55]PWY66768.1 Clavaminate synthase-like protein [Aspergillus heteromorphus CBS 117.55]